MGDPVDSFRLRVVFCKRGRAVMLSHLEVARAIERTVRRAQLPYAVTQGFSPHMKISFGAALPVGVGGLRECFDVFLTYFVPPDDAARALRDASVPDLLVESCDYIDRSEPAASTAYPVSVFEVRLSKPLDALELPASVTVVRKKKTRDLVVGDYLVCDPEVEGDVVMLALRSKPSGSLRPDVLMQAALSGADGVRVSGIMRVAQLRDGYPLGRLRDVR